MFDDDQGVQTKYQNGVGIDNKLKFTVGGTSRYFLADHLGSSLGQANSTGSLTASNSYDSFGNPSNPRFSSRYQFTGREYDNFTGLQFSRARWYNPSIGRFISEDPIGFAGGDVNLYGYVANDPVNYHDPSGRSRSDRPHRSYFEDNLLPSGKIYNFGCPSAGLGIGAIRDFWRNYNDMRQSDWIGGDKFFHCLANCQAARRGSVGSGLSRGLSEARELYDQHVKGDTPSDCDADRYANDIGRGGGTLCGDCVRVCSQFRPWSMPYPVVYPQNNPCRGFGNWSCK